MAITHNRRWEWINREADSIHAILEEFPCFKSYDFVSCLHVYLHYNCKVRHICEIMSFNICMQILWEFEKIQGDRFIQWKNDFQIVWKRSSPITGWWQYCCYNEWEYTSTKPDDCQQGECSGTSLPPCRKTTVLEIPIVNLCSVLRILLASYYVFHRAYPNAFLIIFSFLQEFMLGDHTGIKRTAKYMVFVNHYNLSSI